MKIAFPIAEKSDNPLLDPRFGRAKHILIRDTETGATEIIDNQVNLFAAQGAGIQTASNLSRQQPDAVVVMNCGPKAFTVLNAAAIKVYLTDKQITITEVIEKIKANQLPVMTEANAESHW